MLQKAVSEIRKFHATPSPHHKFSILARKARSIQNTRKPISENREFKAAPSSHHKFPILARREKRSRKRPRQSKRQSLRIENSAPCHPLSTNPEFSQGKGRSKAQSTLQKKTFSEPTYAPSLLLPLPSLKSGKNTFLQANSHLLAQKIDFCQSYTPMVSSSLVKSQPSKL